MPTPPPPQPPPAEVIAKGYQPDQVKMSALLLCVVILLVGAVLIHVGVWWLLKSFMARPRVVDVPQSAVTEVDRFTSPSLQPTQQHDQFPWQDLAQLRAKEAGIFTQLGWKADPSTGSAQIPDSIVAQLQQRYAGHAGAATPGGKP